MKISACIITLNEERNLPRCLSSIAPLVDEFVVIDSGSTDATVDIALKYGAHVVHQDFDGSHKPVQPRRVVVGLVAVPERVCTQGGLEAISVLHDSCYPRG